MLSDLESTLLDDAVAQELSEFTGRHDEDGDRRITDREILLVEVRDRRITELTVDCSGDWDADLRASHASETHLIRS